MLHYMVLRPLWFPTTVLPNFWSVFVATVSSRGMPLTSPGAIQSLFFFFFDTVRKRRSQSGARVSVSNSHRS